MNSFKKGGKMGIIRGLIVFLYTIVVLSLGIFFIGISLGIVPISQINMIFDVIYGSSLNLLYVGLIGIVLLTLSFVHLYSAGRRRKRGKTISFENPDGEVNISLSAIEDFVKRISEDVTEIKQLDCKVTNSKKGLNVTNDVVVYAGISIPEITEKFQNMIKLKLEGILGIENNIKIRMHVKEVQENFQDSSGYTGELDYSK